MNDDDFSAPLIRRSFGDRVRAFKFTPLRFAVATCCLAAASLVGWLYWHHDPLGGEPVVTVKIEPFEEGQNGQSTNLAETQNTDRKTRVVDLPPAGGQLETADNAPVEQEPALRTSTTSGRLVSTRIEGTGELSALDMQFEEDDSFIQDDEPEQQPEHTGSISSASANIRLVKAPVRGFTEKTQFGLLPKISGGKLPAKTYARPVSKGYMKKLKGQIAIVIGGVGLSPRTTKKAVYELPGEVSLAFAPYGKTPQKWVGLARQKGHEIMLQLPMEPYNYPNANPGPGTLLTTSAADENLNKLKHFMGKFTGYIGIVNYMGAKFTTSRSSLGPVMAEFKRRGLYYLDDGSSRRSMAVDIGEEAGVRVLKADLVLDSIPESEAIHSALLRLEMLALKRGWSIGAGSALPVTVEEIGKWAENLNERGIGLVPVSALY